jgi:riboflavin kinase/FMN adenylyltransferase
MVQHYTSLTGVNINNTWLTIGSFDGVHIGHQQLICELNHRAHQAGAKSVVLSFHPHPTTILRGKTGAFYLTTPSEKVKLLDELGTDVVITHPFTFEISQSTAREFVCYLMEHLGFQQIWAGIDFALGRGREGNIDYLKLLGRELNYQVHIVEPITADGRTISSSLIRNLLVEGKIAEANKLSGRLYQVTGEVIHGDGRGKSIGVPTANIESSDERAHVEAHILDYSEDLYSQQISIEFISRLRGEKRFQSVEELISQVHNDINKTREIIAGIEKE